MGEYTLNHITLRKIANGWLIEAFGECVKFIEEIDNTFPEHIKELEGLFKEVRKRQESERAQYQGERLQALGRAY